MRVTTEKKLIRINYSNFNRIFDGKCKVRTGGKREECDEHRRRGGTTIGSEKQRHCGEALKVKMVALRRINICDDADSMSMSDPSASDY